MLPGIRFVIATVMLSAAVLVFGLGAAALLRAAHEEFVTIPAWREAQKPIPQLPQVTQVIEVKPVIAMLRVEPSVSTPNEIVLPDPAKVAPPGDEPAVALAPAPVIAETAPTVVASLDVASPDVTPTPAVTAPVQQRVRRINRARISAAMRRQRAINRARAAQIRLQQQQQQQFQQQQNADPFRMFVTPNNNGT